MKDKILEIMQKNYNLFKGTNEAEIHSSFELEEFFKNEQFDLISDLSRKFFYKGILLGILIGILLATVCL